MITTYEYDTAGRLEWTRQANHRQQNLYDSLGRLSEIREWFRSTPHEYRSTIKKFDFLNRVVEERLEDANGIVLHFSRYEYDIKGNRKFAQCGEQITKTKYNSHHNPIETTNGLGETTRISYNIHYLNSHKQLVLQTITSDPLGYQIIDTYDTANRLVETTRRNPFGISLSRQEIFYDLCGNRCRILDSVMQGGEVKRTIETLFFIIAIIR